MKLFLRKLRWLFHRNEKESDLQEELRFHLEEETEERETRGLAAAEARRAALRDLGNSALIKEDTRAAWSWTLFEQLLQDARYAIRSMLGNKSFTMLAVLSLALGIGANTAIFSFMDSILLRSLPVPDPQSLVTLSWRTPERSMHGTNRHDDSYLDPKGGFIGGFFSYEAFNLFRGNDSVFSSVFGYQGAGSLTLTFRGQAELAKTEYVSGDYFRALAIPPAAGRLIAPDDDRAGAPAVAVMSYSLSQSRFGSPENALGQTIHLNNIPFTVAGVTPPSFFGADPDQSPGIYIPMHTNLLLQAGDRADRPSQLYTNANYDWVVVMARLRPGVTAAEAQIRMAPSFAELQRTAKPKLKPEQRPKLVVLPSAGGLGGLQRRYKKPLYILLAMVGMILAIACANIANLLLARAAARRREIAVRLSIGAGRFRVVRQLLTESVMLSALGGGLGIAFALWGIHALTLLLANGQEDFTLRAELNWRVLTVVAAISLVTGLLFGLAPAIQATRVDVAPALKESRTGEGRAHRFHGFRLSRILIVSQIAITLVILMAAGLFTRTLVKLQSIQTGFNSDNLLTFSVNAAQAGHDDSDLAGFYSNLRTRLAHLPGVVSASLSNHPLVSGGMSGTDIVLPYGARKNTHVLPIGADFFSTMQIPMLAGRGVEDKDRIGSPPVAVVNEMFARTSFGTANPLGKRLVVSAPCQQNCAVEIIGISGNTLDSNLKEKTPPILYLPFAQAVWPIGGMTFELRTAGNPMSFVRSVREIVRQADDRLPISGFDTQRARIDHTIGQEIMFARLCIAFAFLALLISCVGLYATTSYNVARRTGEIGIRMALGAQRTRVVWMVMREVFLLSAIALAISIPAALAASKLIRSFLYDMKPNDPAAMAASVAVLIAAAILAGYLPARTASRIDPMRAVRHE